jgi:membrane associated rhomboid family serine protease
MGAAIALGGAVRVVAVTAIVALVSGLGVWLVAPLRHDHPGCERARLRLRDVPAVPRAVQPSLFDIAVGVVVGAVWGTALLGGLLPQEGISWQAHLFGAVGGVIAARVLATRRNGGRATALAAEGEPRGAAP